MKLQTDAIFSSPSEDPIPKSRKSISFFRSENSMSSNSKEVIITSNSIESNSIDELRYQNADNRKLQTFLSPFTFHVKTLESNTFVHDLPLEKNSIVLIYVKSNDVKKTGKWHLGVRKEGSVNYNMVPALYENELLNGVKINWTYLNKFLNKKTEKEIEEEITNGTLQKSIESQINNIIPAINPEASRIEKHEVEVLIDGKTEILTIVIVNPQKKSGHYNIIHNNDDSFVETLINDKNKIYDFADKSNENLVFFDWPGKGCNRRSKKDYSPDDQIKWAEAAYNFIQQKKNPHTTTFTGEADSAAIFTLLLPTLKDKAKLVNIRSFTTNTKDINVTKAWDSIPKESKTFLTVRTFGPSSYDEKLYGKEIIEKFVDDICQNIITKSKEVKKVTEKTDIGTLCVNKLKENFMKDVVNIHHNFVEKVQDDGIIPEKNSLYNHELNTRDPKKLLANSLIINRLPLIQEATHIWLENFEKIIAEPIRTCTQNFYDIHPNFLNTNTSYLPLQEKLCRQLKTEIEKLINDALDKNLPSLIKSMEQTMKLPGHNLDRKHLAVRIEKNKWVSLDDYLIKLAKERHEEYALSLQNTLTIGMQK